MRGRTGQTDDASCTRVSLIHHSPRLKTGLISNVIFIYQLSPRQQQKLLLIIKKSKETQMKTEWDSCAEFTHPTPSRCAFLHLSQTRLHCRVPVLPLAVKLHSSCSDLRRNASADFHTLPPNKPAASGVSALQGGAGKLLLHLCGDVADQVQPSITCFIFIEHSNAVTTA